jgi:hypothetical protein
MSWLSNEQKDILNAFWVLAGETEPFPRTLERSIALALPIAVVKLPRLHLNDIETWLYYRKISYSFNCQSRSVHGCLIALGGTGIIFLDGSDPPDQLRFTFAHEVAHFLHDYWLIRNKAICSFGVSIAEVMDGLRSPTIDERLHALLGKIPIGIQTNLLDRTANGNDLNQTWKVENTADKLALALLAPPEEVLQRVDLQGMDFPQRRAVLKNLLVNSFGLPAEVADAYSADLLPELGLGPSWAESLKLH